MIRSIVMCLLLLAPAVLRAGEVKAILPGGLQGVEGLLLYVVAVGDRERLQREEGNVVFITLGNLYLRTGEDLEIVSTSASPVAVTGHELFWRYDLKDTLGRRIHLSSHSQYWALTIDDKCYLCTVVTTNSMLTVAEKKQVLDALVELANQKAELRRLLFDPSAEAAVAAAGIVLPGK